MENLNLNNNTEVGNGFNKPYQKIRSRSNSIHYIEETKNKLDKEELFPVIVNESPKNNTSYEEKQKQVVLQQRLSQLKKISAPYRDQNGNFICIYQDVRCGMVGAVLKPNGDLDVIDSKDIHNGLINNESGTILAKKLEQTPEHPWDLVYKNGKLYVWPHMEAAAKMDQTDIFRFMVIRNGFIFNKAVETLREKGFTEAEIKQLKEVKNLRGKTFSEHDLKKLEKKNGFSAQEIDLLKDKKFTKKNMREFEKKFSKEKFIAIKEVENKTKLDLLKRLFKKSLQPPEHYSDHGNDHHGFG